MKRSFLDDRLILRLQSRLTDAREGLVGYGYSPADAEAMIAIACIREMAASRAATANPGHARAAFLDCFDREILRHKIDGSA